MPPTFSLFFVALGVTTAQMGRENLATRHDQHASQGAKKPKEYRAAAVFVDWAKPELVCLSARWCHGRCHFVSAVFFARRGRISTKMKKTQEKTCATQKKIYSRFVTDETNIRTILAAHCAERGNAAKLSKLLRVAPSTIMRWVCGGKIPASRWAAIETACDVSEFTREPCDHSAKHWKTQYMAARIMRDKALRELDEARALLSFAVPIMEKWATAKELDEWHCRMEDLYGTSYPSTTASFTDAEKLITPETDAATYSVDTYAGEYLCEKKTGERWVEADFARKLERERDQYRDALKEIIEERHGSFVRAKALLANAE